MSATHTHVYYTHTATLRARASITPPCPLPRGARPHSPAMALALARGPLLAAARGLGLGRGSLCSCRPGPAQPGRPAPAAWPRPAPPRAGISPPVTRARAGRRALLVPAPALPLARRGGVSPPETRAASRPPPARDTSCSVGEALARLNRWRLEGFTYLPTCTRAEKATVFTRLKDLSQGLARNLKGRENFSVSA